MTLAAAPRSELGNPRSRPEKKPHGREEPVEDDERETEQRVPRRPAPEGNSRARLHEAPAPLVRRATLRRMRCAISSIESSETSNTGQPRRRWIAAAYSSSS